MGSFLDKGVVVEKPKKISHAIAEEHLTRRLDRVPTAVAGEITSDTLTLINEKLRLLVSGQQEILALLKPKKELVTVIAGPGAPTQTPTPWVEVPSYEAIVSAAERYLKAHGGPALKARLKQFDAKKLSDIPDEQRAAFLGDLEET